MPLKNIYILLILFVNLLFSGISLANTNDKIMKVAAFPKQNIQGEIAVNIIRAAYKGLGYDIKIHRLPGARSIVEVNRGELDAELMRIKGMEKSFPYLVPVKTHLMYMQVSAFSRAKNIEIQDWQDLKPFKLAFELGFKLLENNTKGMDVIKTNGPHHAFRIMAEGKADIVIDLKLDGQAYIKQQNLTGIHMIEPALKTFPVYHYVHIQHKKLVRFLEQALLNMHETGESARIHERIVNKSFSHQQ